jgi:hypothetical protein
MGERRPLTHAVRVSENSAAFRCLFEALEREGERAGWLDLGTPSSGPSTAPAAARANEGDLGAAIGAGVWKAVGVEPGRAVAIKRRRGAPVLRDLLREHFRGCRLVFVRGDASLPFLRPRGEDWELERGVGELRRFTTAELVRALRSPLFGA